MRCLALCILLIAPMAHAGESQPHGPAVTPRTQVSEADVRHAYSAFVEKTYGVRGTMYCASTTSEADAVKYLDYMTTNKAYPQQFTVIKTGWTHRAPDD